MSFVAIPALNQSAEVDRIVTLEAWFLIEHIIMYQEFLQPEKLAAILYFNSNQPQDKITGYAV